MEANFSKAALMQYIDTKAKEGTLNPNTAASFRAAAVRLLEDIGDDEDVRSIDINTAGIKYHNRHPGKVSTESLKIYTLRLKRLIADFQSYVVDPLNHKPPSRGMGKLRTPRAKGNAEIAAATGSVKPETAGSAPDINAGSTSATNMVLPYPIRENFMAQIIVPRNMTTDEGRRLCAFIMTLTADFKPAD